MQNPQSSLFRQIWRGLTQPGLLALFVTLLVTAAGFAYIALAYDAQMVREGHRWVYTGKGDRYGYLSVLTERMRHSDSETPILLYGGASNSGRALVAPPLFDEMVKASYPDYDTFLFWSGGLSIFEVEAIAVASQGRHGKRPVKLLLSCTMLQAITSAA